MEWSKTGRDLQRTAASVSKQLLTKLNLSLSMPSKRMQYTSKFKLQVISFVEVNGNRAAGQQFSVSEV